MSVLETLDFQPMLITDVFESVTASKAWYDKNKIQPGPGSYPYVSRSRLSNGNESVVGFQDLPPNAGNAITIGVDTQSVFYQPAPFYTSVKIQVLRHSRMTTASALVLVAVLRGQMMKFQWGNGVSLDRLRASHIMVPAITIADGTLEPDWDGMDRLGAELLDQATTRTYSARETRLADDDTLPELRFEPMFITDVFDSMKPAGKWFDLAKAERHGSPVSPYVARSGESNGIGAFLPLQSYDAPNAGNAITIGVSTSTVFYQPVKFYTSKEIQVLRHPRLGPDNALVLVALLREQMMKFQWGNGASIARLQATRIMVPVVANAEGNDVVDWDGMSAYGHALRVRAEHAIAPVIGDPS